MAQRANKKCGVEAVLDRSYPENHILMLSASEEARTSLPHDWFVVLSPEAWRACQSAPPASGLLAVQVVYEDLSPVSVFAKERNVEVPQTPPSFAIKIEDASQRLLRVSVEVRRLSLSSSSGNRRFRFGFSITLPQCKDQWTWTDPLFILGRKRAAATHRNRGAPSCPYRGPTERMSPLAPDMAAALTALRQRWAAYTAAQLWRTPDGYVNTAVTAAMLQCADADRVGLLTGPTRLSPRAFGSAGGSCTPVFWQQERVDTTSRQVKALEVQLVLHIPPPYRSSLAALTDARGGLDKRVSLSVVRYDFERLWMYEEPRGTAPGHGTLVDRGTLTKFLAVTCDPAAGCVTLAVKARDWPTSKSQGDRKYRMVAGFKADGDVLIYGWTDVFEMRSREGEHKGGEDEDADEGEGESEVGGFGPAASISSSSSGGAGGAGGAGNASANRWYGAGLAVDPEGDTTPTVAAPSSASTGVGGFGGGGGGGGAATAMSDDWDPWHTTADAVAAASAASAATASGSDGGSSMAAPPSEGAAASRKRRSSAAAAGSSGATRRPGSSSSSSRSAHTHTPASSPAHAATGGGHAAQLGPALHLEQQDSLMSMQPSPKRSRPNSSVGYVPRGGSSGHGSAHGSGHGSSSSSDSSSGDGDGEHNSAYMDADGSDDSPSLGPPPQYARGAQLLPNGQLVGAAQAPLHAGIPILSKQYSDSSVANMNWSAAPGISGFDSLFNTNYPPTLTDSHNNLSFADLMGAGSLLPLVRNGSAAAAASDGATASSSNGSGVPYPLQPVTLSRAPSDMLYVPGDPAPHAHASAAAAVAATRGMWHHALQSSSTSAAVSSSHSSAAVSASGAPAPGLSGAADSGANGSFVLSSTSPPKLPAIIPGLSSSGSSGSLLGGNDSMSGMQLLMPMPLMRVASSTGSSSGSYPQLPFGSPSLLCSISSLSGETSSSSSGQSHGSFTGFGAAPPPPPAPLSEMQAQHFASLGAGGDSDTHFDSHILSSQNLSLASADQFASLEAAMGGGGSGGVQQQQQRAASASAPVPAAAAAPAAPLTRLPGTSLIL